MGASVAIRDGSQWECRDSLQCSVYNPMRLLAVLILALMAAACNQEQDITGSTAACPVRNYSSYNPRDMNQCVAACKACDHGNTVTCTTSCTLKGAH
ncbi:hypothetical protein AB7M42_005093 [Bradyrhizobium diazoefficiens]|uniref:Uncharacterized protein n=2 Tax=Nitrobacteraceae TaxID=41294 RepID=A0A810AL83_9BRAD|nr:hypothetical protein F07S3_53170 [Bradyrhizobium diazoefficiens]BCA04598.1 hypothetical protein H12S4_55020 [Bradyrhizobium diazoefficiens]BCA13168.1 hypothetical protein BDHF08_50150 [Bradyrhizobium diazoefficiens]BCA21953.1 hypothetical protein BDHH15_51680 [Bradyrhizobium diazoefficiens]BCE31273.1 hypothetical protein XF2B_50420 [Bradyrhizobium diazoefficiens]